MSSSQGMMFYCKKKKKKGKGRTLNGKTSHKHITLSTVLSVFPPFLSSRKLALANALGLSLSDEKASNQEMPGSVTMANRHEQAANYERLDRPSPSTGTKDIQKSFGIEILRQSSDRYKTVRHRFLDTYKRDQLCLRQAHSMCQFLSTPPSAQTATVGVMQKTIVGQVLTRHIFAERKKAEEERRVAERGGHGRAGEGWPCLSSRTF